MIVNYTVTPQLTAAIVCVDNDAAEMKAASRVCCVSIYTDTCIVTGIHHFHSFINCYSGREQELEKMLRETDVSNLSQLVTSVNLVQLSKKNEALFNDGMQLVLARLCHCRNTC